jgi:hypothetical protein
MPRLDENTQQYLRDAEQGIRSRTSSWFDSFTNFALRDNVLEVAVGLMYDVLPLQHILVDLRPPSPPAPTHSFPTSSCHSSPSFRSLPETSMRNLLYSNTVRTTITPFRPGITPKIRLSTTAQSFLLMGRLSTSSCDSLLLL